MGLLKLPFFYINCLKKFLEHFSFYLLTFLSWTCLSTFLYKPLFLCQVARGVILVAGSPSHASQFCELVSAVVAVFFLIISFQAACPVPCHVVSIGGRQSVPVFHGQAVHAVIGVLCHCTCWSPIIFHEELFIPAGAVPISVICIFCIQQCRLSREPCPQAFQPAAAVTGVCGGESVVALCFYERTIIVNYFPFSMSSFLKEK